MNSNTDSNLNGREEKVLEGVYITRNNKSKDPIVINQETNSDRKQDTNIPNQCKYVYRSTAELIAILENDFEHIFKEIQMLYEANEDMMNYDPNDYDLIEAREENLVIINYKLNSLIEIQNQLRQHCPTNPLVTKNIFDFFKEIQKSKEKDNSDVIDVEDNNENLNSNNINEINSNIDNQHSTQNNKIKKDENGIITDIEL